MRQVLLTLAGLSLAVFPQSVFADQGAVEEVIVTATKREESIQDVPIAVSAFSGEDLEARGVNDLYGLQEVSPSVAVYNSNSTSNGGTLRIRGVGTTGNNPGLESAVGTFIDGVYRSRAGQAFSDLIDIDRVEVLRGPQGTLFGKNTVAGALNIITKQPEFENNASITVGAGNLSLFEARGFANFVIAEDTLAGRISATYQDRDGHYEDINSSDTFDKRDRYSLKGQLLWTPNDDLSVRVIADLTERDEDCCPAAYWINGPVSAFVAALGGDTETFEIDGDSRVGVNFKPFEEVEDSGLSVEANWDVGEVTITSITAFREYQVDRGQDIDFGSADILVPQYVDETFENFSQEFRVLGGTDNFDWLVGGYYYTEDIDTSEIIALSEDGPAYLSLLFTGGASATDLAPIFEGNPAGRNAPNQGYDASYFSESEGWSVFTHNVWHATDKLDFTLGFRIGNENKKAGAIINGAPIDTAIDDPFCAAIPIGSLCDNASWVNEEDETEWTGTVKAAYQVAEDMNIYFGFSRGYKAGGYNLDQEAVGTIDPADPDPINATLFIDQSRFDPEFSDAYELGVKSEWMDGKLVVNGALFYTDFEDFQLNSFNGLGFTISNLPQAVTQGIELEGQYLFSPGVFVTAGVTYADARYGDDLPNNAFLEDKRLTQSPLWQGSAAIFVDKQLLNTDWRALANLNWAHIGGANTGSDLDPEKERGTYNQFNGSFGVASPDGRYEINLWGRNLTDKRVNSLVFDSVFQAGSWNVIVNPPRTYGVTFKANLGQ